MVRTKENECTFVMSQYIVLKRVMKQNLYLALKMSQIFFVDRVLRLRRITLWY